MYKFIYQFNEHEKSGFETVQDLVDAISEWHDTLLVTENFDGSCDKIVNQKTGEIVAYAACRSLLEKHGIEAGDCFYSGLMRVGTYADSEIGDLT